MKAPRFRVRTLLILVLLAGIGVWGDQMWRRSARYAGMADSFASQEADALRGVESNSDYAKRIREIIDWEISWRASLQKADGWDAQIKFSEEAESIDREILKDAEAAALEWAQQAEWADLLKKKYSRAARYPFLPVAPDAPEPLTNPFSTNLSNPRT